MRTENVPFEKLGFSSLFTDYLRNEEKCLHFFPAGAFEKWESYQNRIKHKSSGADRAHLADALLSYNKPFSPGEKTLENIEALRDEDTHTVVTGQQMGLFGGPLYVFFKALSVIKLSIVISKKYNIRVVPVFWLADEDHDFEEISKIFIPAGNALKEFKLESHPQQDFSAGKLDLPEDFNALIDNFAEHLPDTEFKSDSVSIIRESWQISDSWRSAFGTMMIRLFDKYGLVLAGSDSLLIKKLAVPIFQKAVTRAVEIQDALNAVSSEVETNYHQQAAIGSSTLFYHDSEKGRLKLDYKDDKWLLADSAAVFSTEEILSDIDNHPERFSPNVFLRPAVQEYLLPNLAYIGGPAEIAYFAQMGKMMQLFDLTLPVIVPRLSATLVEPPVSRIMDGLPFAFDQYTDRIENLEKAYVEMQKNGDTDDFFSKWKAELHEMFNNRMEFLVQKDASLKGAAKGASVRTEKEVDKLQQKFNRALKQQESTQLNRIKRIHNALFPDNSLQERTVNWLYFLAKYGVGLPEKISGQIGDELDFSSSHYVIHL